MSLTPEIKRRYLFSSQIIDVIIGGQSAIDSATGLNIKTPEDTARFLNSYGYDLDNPIEKAELFGNFQEAIQFIKQYFLKPQNPEGLDLEIPKKILEISDISQLLLISNSYRRTEIVSSEALSLQQGPALWACAIIKVMHTIAHMDKDLGAYYFSDVLKQILDRFYKHIYSDDSGQATLGKDARDLEHIDLVLFECKPRKSRDSVILKLLHKPENVAEEIFDRVGIRFVTKNKFDALRVIKYLKEHNVIMPANIKPSRSRNTLIDMKVFLHGLPRILEQAELGQINSEDIYTRVAALCEGAYHDDKKNNPHSSEGYRSIQFTGRHLIKLKNPLYDEIKSLKKAVKDKTCPDEILSLVERIDLRNIQKETRFFYPFEVQIYDEEAHKENLAGRSSHANYKKSQIRAAMKRVMGSLAFEKDK